VTDSSYASLARDWKKLELLKPSPRNLQRQAGLTHFEDIVPKPYQEFKDIFTKESFNELPDQKKWDHTIELFPDSQEFSTKVYPLSPVK